MLSNTLLGEFDRDLNVFHLLILSQKYLEWKYHYEFLSVEKSDESADQKPENLPISTKLMSVCHRIKITPKKRENGSLASDLYSMCDLPGSARSGNQIRTIMRSIPFHFR